MNINGTEVTAAQILAMALNPQSRRPSRPRLNARYGPGRVRRRILAVEPSAELLRYLAKP